MAADLLERTGAKDGNGQAERPGIVADEEQAAPEAKRRGGRRITNPEIIALDTIMAELESLTPAQQARVSAYLWGWCQERMGVTAITTRAS